ncbi:putative nucleoside-diphosphate sugar epimerase [Sphaerochaeta pleomorpha str. Grapes]|uniref:Putative nucleoside-diphosphate sugar epimerase n=1 Tax=Sphaerochaeta pleomorpha (strain ATCC BAA-1885 / DSM 22778 / Grapes) TaxID=158190 RepID=G8QWW7_SPHPG|nr:nucleoside-diphosphate sugar epimerase/dehydratase [Sphaerochaeta pleomorpha]AEV29471.1 putative nucleoside-diphosphate sugar epimerase [Sphaerochaeta pleomorpha str. Grapes]
MRKRRMRQVSLMAIDAFLLVFCGFLSSWIVLHAMPELLYRVVLANGVSVLLLLFVVRFYKIRVSESSLDLLSRGLLGFVPVFVLGILLVALLDSFSSIWIPFLIVMDWSSFLCIMGIRVVYRSFLNRKNIIHANGLPKAVVYGAGELGSTIVRQFQKGNIPFHIVGFVDDDPAILGTYIVGTRVLGTTEALGEVLVETQAKVLIIAISNIDQEHMFKAVDAAKEHGCDVKVIPSLFEVQQGAKELDLRNLDYPDLLGRPLTFIDKKPIADMVKGKRVLVTGSGGSIGSEICRQLLTYEPAQLVLLDIDETELHDLSLRLHNYQKEWSDLIVPVVCDIKNARKINQIYEKFQPQLVFHAAAYKHVPLQELYPEEAITTNIGGSYNVLKGAVDHKVERVVVISTDKAVNPTNVMGATKRVVEMLASMLTNEETEMVCVRFGNVLGSRGSMLPLFMDQIKAGVPITVTHKDIIRYFMAIPEAVGLVFKAASMAKGGEVMVLDMGQPVRIYDFAQKLVKYYGDGRSQVIITGLRPGEKLYEELLANKDETIPTEDKLVFKAKLENHVLKPEMFQPIYDTLNTATTEGLLQELQQLVPEFKYQHSTFVL